MKAGWHKTTLGAAFATTTGNTPPKNNADFYGQFIPLVKPPELCDATLDSAEDGLSESGARVARTLPPNSILVSCIGNLGKIGLNTAPVAFNQQINAILPDIKKAIPEFMFYQVLSCSFKEQLEALASGTTVPIVNKSKFNSIEIVLPPLPEQQRIVSILDEAFDGIATAKANAEKNLQNARALFESHLQTVFSQRGEGWVENTLGDIAQVKGGKRVPKGYKLLAEQTVFPYLRVTDFTDSGTIDMSDLRYVGPEVHRVIKNYVIYSNDLYISIAGTIGKTGIIPEELDGANLTENACRLVFKPGISNRFVYYFTLTADFIEQTGLNTRTAAQPKLAL